MLKILQARLQQTWTMNVQMFKLFLEKAEEPDVKLPNSLDHEKSKSSRKTSISALLTMPKPLTVWITINCGKFWKRWAYQTTWLASWETCMTVRKQHLELDGTTDWFQIGKGVCQGCILSPCFFNLYAEYIMRNARLDEAQAGIKIARRNINNLRYADDTSLIAESEEELREKTMAPHSSILAWKIPWTEEPGWLLSMGSLRVRHDWTTCLWFFTFMHWRRKWQPTPLFLPGESQGWGSLVGCHLGVAQHRTRLKWLRSSSSSRRTKEPVDESERVKKLA